MESRLTDTFSEPRAAYVHVPFCAHRCGYCDFTLVARKDRLIGDYLRALEIDLHTLERPRPVDTLYFGGGTPTHLPAAELSQLLQLARRWFDPSPGYEFSVEANPSGLDQEKLAALTARGVNRVSLGVQSFDASVLQLLERDHSADDVERAVSLLRRQFSNFSIDLIFGVPGQSLALWRETLKRGIDLAPPHISLYGLTYEKGTSFWTRRAKGELLPAVEELERDMYAAAMDELAAAGFEQYELSNFARPGFRCRHNEVYWAGDSYYGFGPGAARYIDGRRETNHRSVTTWLQRVFSGKSPIGDAEQLSAEDRAREIIVLGLRRGEGIDRHQFQLQTGFALDELATTAIARHTSYGLLDDDGHRLRLTREGRFVADSVIVDFL